MLMVVMVLLRVLVLMGVVLGLDLLLPCCLNRSVQPGFVFNVCSSGDALPLRIFRYQLVMIRVHLLRVVHPCLGVGVLRCADRHSVQEWSLVNDKVGMNRGIVIIGRMCK